MLDTTVIPPHKYPCRLASAPTQGVQGITGAWGIGGWVQMCLSAKRHELDGKDVNEAMDVEVPVRV